MPKKPKIKPTTTHRGGAGRCERAAQPRFYGQKQPRETLTDPPSKIPSLNDEPVKTKRRKLVRTNDFEGTDHIRTPKN